MTFAVRPAIPRTRLALLAGILLFTYAYFYQAGDWGANSRFDLVRAILDRGTLTIDAYHENTGDKARVDDHYYTEKAPGPSLFAVPVVGVTRLALRGAGVPFDSPRGIAVQSWVAVVWTASIPTVIGAIALLLVSLAFGASAIAATFGALVFALGTPAFAYATLFWGNPMATSGLVVAFAAAVALREDGSRRRALGLGLLVGAAAGGAVLGEFTSAGPAVFLSALVAVHTWRERPRFLAAAAGVAAGAGVAAAIMGAYNAAAFGSPFHLGYQSVANPAFEGMKSGLLGIHPAKLSIALKILFGLERGLLPLVPVFAAAPIGVALLIRDRATRAAGITCALIVVYYVVVNAGYTYWDGGGNYGPRHIAPTCAFLAIGLPPVWMRVGRAARAGMVALGALGFAFAFVVVSTHAIPNDSSQGPLPAAAAAFARGELARNVESYLYEEANVKWPRTAAEEAALTRDASNLGEVVGIPRGLASLLPLVLAWIAAGIAWRRHHGAPVG